MIALSVPGKLPAMANPLYDRILERMTALGLNEHSAALKANVSIDTIRDLRRNKRQSLRVDTLSKLAVALETTVGVLSGEDQPAASSVEMGETQPHLGQPVRAATMVLPTRQQMREDVPVLGTALGSIVHHVEGFHFEGGQIDTVRRPPALAGARDLYAVYVAGDSMFPAHPSGELRFVHPHRPCQIGDTVIVTTRDHNDAPAQAYIKVLKKRAATSLFLEQYNPAATIEIPVKYVISMHRVLTMNELFGI